MNRHSEEIQIITPRANGVPVFCHHGCVGAGMERISYTDGCWMPTEPPNDRNQSTPPDHGIDREASGSTECLTQHSNEQGKKLALGLLYWLA
jgi:hypothetical protein